MDGIKEITEKQTNNDAAALLTHVLNALNGFAAVQQEQLQKLTDGRLKDIMSWRQKRQRFFDRLRKYLELVETNNRIRKDHDLLGKVQKKVQTILEAERVLHDAALRHKERLANELGTLRKGRKAVQGYRLHGVITRPKFLSNRT